MPPGTTGRQGAGADRRGGAAAERVLTDSTSEVEGYLTFKRHSIFHESHLDAEGQSFRWANCIAGDGFLRVPVRSPPGVPASVERLCRVARAEGSGLLAFTDDPRAVWGRPSLPTHGPVATQSMMRHPSRDPRREN